MSVPLVVDGIRLADDARRTIKQQLSEVIGGQAIPLANNGLIFRGVKTNKLQTVISGSGWSASGLSGVDFTQPVVIKCIESLSRSGTAGSNIITLPANRRSDVPEVGYATTADGDLVETPIDDITGNVFTLATVAGAVSYKVDYWPEITVLGAVLEEDCSADTAIWSWSLTGREQ